MHWVCHVHNVCGRHTEHMLYTTHVVHSCQKMVYSVHKLCMMSAQGVDMGRHMGRQLFGVKTPDATRSLQVGS